MNEREQDQYCNECITKATALNKEAAELLKKNDLQECLRKNYESVFLAMKAVLSLDELYPEDDPSVERMFRQRYVDNGMVSDELSDVLMKLDEAYDDLQRGGDLEISKPECGYFTSKAGLFTEEAVDILVMKNSRFMGQ